MGTFVGHAVPGTGFILWGAWWFGHTVYRLTRQERLAGGESTMPTHDRPTEGQESTTHPIPWPISTYFTPVEPAVKIGVPLAGAIGELWWGNWKLDDSSVINFQHATMYLGFLFAGIVDLLQMKGLTPRSSGHIALIAAFTLEGVLFMGHANPPGLETRVHVILVGTMFFEALVLLLELRYPYPTMSAIKSFGLILQGTWFWQISYMLFYATYDPSNHANSMRATLFFTWHFILIAILMFAVYYAARFAALRSRHRGVVTA